MSDQVTLRRPKTKATATVRARAVQAWSRAGWQPVHTDPAPGTAAAPARYLVLAGSRDQALAWAREQPGVTQKSVTYASKPDVVSGLDPDGLTVVELDSFPGHRHEAEIRAALAAAFTPTTQPVPAGSPDAAAAGTSTAPTEE